jgi:hypothetical protein
MGTRSELCFAQAKQARMEPRPSIHMPHRVEQRRNPDENLRNQTKVGLHVSAYTAAIIIG